MIIDGIEYKPVSIGIDFSSGESWQCEMTVDGDGNWHPVNTDEYSQFNDKWSGLGNDNAQ